MVKKHLPILLLLAFGVACAAWLLSLDPRARFTTDVSELLPADERDPQARLALSFVRERQSRVVLIALDAPATASPAALASAARVFTDSLRASPAFVSAHPLSDASWRQTVGRQIHARRFDLLLPAWLAGRRAEHAAESPSTPFPAWLAERVVGELDAHLASPSAGATADLLPSDPLLLLPSLADRAPSLAAAPESSASGLNAPVHALIWAETRHGPLSEAGQDPVFAALHAAEAAAQGVMPGLAARHSGVAHFAAAAKASTRAEITRLNTVALFAVLLVAACFVRRLPPLLHLLPIVALATLGAAAVTTAVFPRVHVLVFVLGSLLSGVAVDYGFHLLLGRRAGEPFPARLRRLALPLVGGALTTVAGFLILCVSELPLVRQLGVYVAAGIVCGLGVTLLYLARLPHLDLAPRRAFIPPVAPTRFRGPLLAALAVVAVVGLARVRWHDDLRSLEYPAPALRAADADLRRAFGQTGVDASFLTRGASYAEARERWQQFAATSPAGAPLSALAPLLPRPADYAAATSPAARAELAAFATAFAGAAGAADYTPGAFSPFQTDLAAHLAVPAADYESLLRDTIAALPGPLGLLALADAEGVAFVSTAPLAFPVPPGAAGTVSLSGIESLNTLFSRYRAATLRLALGGCAALVLVACALHGLRAGLRTAALPLLAAGLAFSLLAFARAEFGLFHLLGALLGVCLADDYAHFASAGDEARISIRLSALTTAASFGALTLSAIPAVSALGLTVVLILSLALVFVEIDLFSLRSHVR